MKKFAAMGLVFILSIGLLTGCGASYEAQENTVYVLKNGKVVSTDVEAFDEDTYDEEELADYVKEAIDAYTGENGNGTVKQRSLSVKDNVATLILEYASAEDYTAFNGIELFQGTIAEALAAGYSFDVEFGSVKDGKGDASTAFSDFRDDDSLKVVVIRGSVDVQINGTILYASVQNVAMIDKSTISIGTGHSLLDSAAEAGTESAGVTETVDGTEAEETTEDGGSVGEDELEVGTESTEMTFDFGEEVTPDESGETSSVYTYIIYK